jgi:hypothetical protein
MKKVSRNVIESKMIFCREHALFMYSRKILKIEKFSDFESEFFDSFDDELSNIENVSKEIFERF